ncbi:HAMP domain-containing sensor histidine kinase [Paenibacillus sp. GP183]|uniref:sensor histidine kinase n=1 Tax=Paenibacillus sp. GP183 TaxID=1882751 RepID=UPI00089DA32B|nr:HAMP domain-containing sensor histidine kinase [Paenibacillus sp. GP183]SEC81737.1 Signal transduction histidine kinase [Paenibacillus sp. GP183]
MSIKMRLLLSYIAMTIIPVVLFALIAATLASVFFKNAGTGSVNGMPAIWDSTNQRNELIAGVKFMARTDPDRFTDSGFLKNTDEELNLLQAGLVVMRSERMSFVSPFVDSPDLNKQLQGLPTGSDSYPWGKKVGGRFTVAKYDISFSDHSAGTVYVLSDMNLMIDNAKKFFPLLVLCLLVVTGLTNGILTFLVSRSIIKPLYRLKHAAEQIKEGNLDHEVNLIRKDEIGKLSGAFEEMRVRLKESIQLQLQYEENRKELISNISHDLKTPITGIKACVEGIQDGIADTGPKQEKYMSMIAKKTEEMDRLIDELFLFSKLDLNRLPFNLEPMDLEAYLRDFVEELRLDPRMAGVSVAFSFFGDRPVSVTADREKLGRVIMNIIENSLKYMNKATKEIRIDLFDGNNEATVEIQDNGSGIEDAALPHIFNRFYRADPSRNKALGGSGLGLAIVKQIIEGQGGNVWAESTLGEGTSIYFTLRKTKHGGELL